MTSRIPTSPHRAARRAALPETSDFFRTPSPTILARPGPAAILIGPEGGFTPAELEAAATAGVTLAGLGPRILRSRTVALAAAAAILSRTGDFA